MALVGPSEVLSASLHQKTDVLAVELTEMLGEDLEHEASAEASRFSNFGASVWPEDVVVVQELASVSPDIPELLEASDSGEDIPEVISVQWQGEITFRAPGVGREAGRTRRTVGLGDPIA